MRAFREAVEAGDMDAVEALLAEDVAFTSPVVFKPYAGRDVTAAILRGVAEVFEDFRYVREIGDPAGPDHALVFTARVGDRMLTGCDFLHVGEDGLIDDFTVMVRPLSGAQALAEAMGARFEQIAKEAEARSA
ncbi:membrane protein [Streptomyces lucensis JCM 4490]|uniref:Membrane protein n=1 Tax=Streptomyces lucensis JCM 4490 TaxID=1306176 RepID=A0A918J3W2_9ACTN|nr:nuclear transport factor 2 family protein [Streptomyces lucensis]GGW41701.1 membrane protein [Streptomyces lucensis JCM 4490]